MTKKNTDEIFIDRNIEVSVPPQDKPKKKAKKEVSAERRAVLLAQLKKGRETAKQNRLAKKNKKTPTSGIDSVDKPEPQVSTENTKVISMNKPKTTFKKSETKLTEKEPEIKQTWSIHDDINDLKYQLRELRNMMNKSKKEEKVEAKIEKIIEKKEIIEEKQNSTQSTQSTHNPKPPPSQPIPIPQRPQRVVKSLFRKAMW